MPFTKPGVHVSANVRLAIVNAYREWYRKRVDDSHSRYPLTIDVSLINTRGVSISGHKFHLQTRRNARVDAAGRRNTGSSLGRRPWFLVGRASLCSATYLFAPFRAGRARGVVQPLHVRCRAHGASGFTQKRR